MIEEVTIPKNEFDALVKIVSNLTTSQESMNKKLERVLNFYEVDNPKKLKKQWVNQRQLSRESGCSINTILKYYIEGKLITRKIHDRLEYDLHECLNVLPKKIKKLL